MDQLSLDFRDYLFLQQELVVSHVNFEQLLLQVFERDMQVGVLLLFSVKLVSDVHENIGRTRIVFALTQPDESFVEERNQRLCGSY